MAKESLGSRREFPRLHRMRTFITGDIKGRLHDFIEANPGVELTYENTYPVLREQLLDEYAGSPWLEFIMFVLSEVLPRMLELFRKPTTGNVPEQLVAYPPMMRCTAEMLPQGKDKEE